MPHNAAFHQGLHCLLRLKQSSGKEIQSYFEIITCDPLISTMDYPKFIVSYQVAESISIQRVIYETKRVVSDEKKILTYYYDKRKQKKQTPIL